MEVKNVVAAIITSLDDDEHLTILTTQRGYGDLAGLWEFPGGKVEQGESPEEALKREIKEELDVEVSVGTMINTVEYDYPDFHISMNCYLCKIVDGDIVLNEHRDAKWLTIDKLDTVEWLPADCGTIEKLKFMFGYV